MLLCRRDFDLFKRLLVQLDTFDSGIIFYRSRGEFYTKNEEDARQRATFC